MPKLPHRVSFPGRFYTLLIAAFGVAAVSAAALALLPIAAPTGGRPRPILNGAYRLACDLESQPRGSIMCYVPRYKPMERAVADMYAALFGLDEDFTGEDDDFYVYEGDSGKLTADKWLSMIRYESGAEASGKTVPLESDEKAAETALSFARDHSLALYHEETVVKSGNDGAYDVTFVDRIGNLKNYAFMNNIKMDACGNILSMDYYYTRFDNLTGCETMSMSEAALLLPETEGLTLIDRAALIYYFEDSIVQPAYLFEGQTEGGLGFECFIKAAKY